MLVYDAGGSQIVRLSSMDGSSLGVYGGPGSETLQFRLGWISKIRVDTAGSVYVCDERNWRVQVLSSVGAFVRSP